VLADFRDWLLAGPPPAPPPAAAEPVDLHTLVAQFTALRHEVNLQTKATRAAVEQTAKLLDHAPAADPARPLLETLVGVADALAVSLRQVERLQKSLDDTLVKFSALELPDLPPGLRFLLDHRHADPPARSGGSLDRVSGWRRWFGHRPERDEQAKRPRELVIGVMERDSIVGWLDEAKRIEREYNTAASTTAGTVRQVATATADGYALSLRRVERALAQHGLAPIECVGRPFDPDTMEAIETAAGGPPGTVVEEVRRGYRLNGKVFRFAQVKVAR
jgi:molecular chaperone GrpE